MSFWFCPRYITSLKLQSHEESFPSKFRLCLDTLLYICKLLCAAKWWDIWSSIWKWENLGFCFHFTGTLAKQKLYHLASVELSSLEIWHLKTLRVTDRRHFTIYKIKSCHSVAPFCHQTFLFLIPPYGKDERTTSFAKASVLSLINKRHHWILPST